jgi:hypothetical protein
LNYQEASLCVCIDDRTNGGLCGRIVGRRLSSAIFFSDVSDFIIQVDALLDAQNFPQAFQRIRSFTDKELPDVPAVMTRDKIAAPDDIDAIKGSVATFALQISSRRNASWQGFIDWMDGSQKQFFSSTLELLKFVDARLQA